MDFNQVKELIAIIDASNLTEMELILDNASMKLSKNTAGFPKETQGVKSASIPVVSNVGSETAAVKENKIDAPITIIPSVKEEFKAGFIVKSPIVGVFYESPAPGKPAFVKVGAKVSKGDLLCIIEAMKVMNEINSEVSGEVAEIFVKDGDMVEFDQPLFRIAE